ncbi:MAG: hypothetical protein HY848_04640 [Betaproteobacteria bacterium]|nr:hypothetical protein [Betaproteobacteria bacterium]
MGSSIGAPAILTLSRKRLPSSSPSRLYWCRPNCCCTPGAPALPFARRRVASASIRASWALGSRQLDPLLPAMKAHGVPWLIRHLNGELSLDEAAAGSIMDTRRYAKRQVTWFRNQMKDWPQVAPEEAQKALESQLLGLSSANLQAK